MNKSKTKVKLPDHVGLESAGKPRDPKSGKYLPIEFNREVFKALIQFKPTKEYVASYMNIHVDTIDSKCKEIYGRGWQHVLNMYSQHLELSLKQKAISKALKGDNIMLIFSLKNICDWSDNKKKNNEVEQKNTIKLTYNFDNSQQLKPEKITVQGNNIKTSTKPSVIEVIPKDNDNDIEDIESND